MTSGLTSGLELSIENARAFLYKEARLLDETRFEAWLEMLSRDLEYLMPTRFVRKAAERDLEYSDSGHGVDYLRENFASLEQRVRKTRHRMSWSDNPAPRTIHLVSNVEIVDEVVEGGIRGVGVNSVCDVYRSRFAGSEDRWSFRRYDVLCLEDSDWKLRRREIVYPDPVLLSSNLNIFF
jgi:3-phenylpropionate/cinnamic acid dioxygenase small subunit